MTKLFQAPAQIQGISTLKDRTLKLTVYISREIPAEDKTKLFELEQSEGWFLFSPNTIKLTDIPLEDAKVETNQKSPSQRMRNIIYRIWEYNTSRQQSFNDFYNNYMNKLNETLKKEINKKS